MVALSISLDAVALVVYRLLVDALYVTCDRTKIFVLILPLSIVGPGIVVLSLSLIDPVAACQLSLSMIEQGLVYLSLPPQCGLVLCSSAYFVVISLGVGILLNGRNVLGKGVRGQRTSLAFNSAQWSMTSLVDGRCNEVNV